MGNSSHCYATASHGRPYNDITRKRNDEPTLIPKFTRSVRSDIAVRDGGRRQGYGRIPRVSTRLRNRKDLILSYTDTETRADVQALHPTDDDAYHFRIVAHTGDGVPPLTILMTE